jgi:hypothetical protein
MLEDIMNAAQERIDSNHERSMENEEEEEVEDDDDNDENTKGQEIEKGDNNSEHVADSGVEEVGEDNNKLQGGIQQKQRGKSIISKVASGVTGTEEREDRRKRKSTEELDDYCPVRGRAKNKPGRAFEA